MENFIENFPIRERKKIWKKKKKKKPSCAHKYIIIFWLTLP